MPLVDITNVRASLANAVAGKFHVNVSDPSRQPTKQYQHDPYSWNCLPATSTQLVVSPSALEQDISLQQLSGSFPMLATAPSQTRAPISIVIPSIATIVPTVTSPTMTPGEKQENIVCKCTVQFRCHIGEFNSPIQVRKGQYVIVQGDRGIDVGIVIRIVGDFSNGTPTAQQLVGAVGVVLRFATQREVDYWNTDLKADEAAALSYCQQRSQKLSLPMEIKHAEFQFDKKKLTFYYDAKARVDFVNLLKELFREYSCRIWMEKVRGAE